MHGVLPLDRDEAALDIAIALVCKRSAEMDLRRRLKLLTEGKANDSMENSCDDLHVLADQLLIPDKDGGGDLLDLLSAGSGCGGDAGPGQRPRADGHNMSIYNICELLDGPLA